MTNKYPGTCDSCGKIVPAYAGHYLPLSPERRARAHRRRAYGIIRCADCVDRIDNSGVEDRACGEPVEPACGEPACPEPAEWACPEPAEWAAAACGL